MSDSAFVVTSFLNPCVDPAYVTINAAEGLEDVDYTADNSASIFAHLGDFTIDTVPSMHDLCGSLAYTATFDGAVIGTDSTPVSFDSSSPEFFTVQTYDLGGETKTYTLSAQLANYPVSSNPTAPSVTLDGSINFIAAAPPAPDCSALTTFTSTAQTNPADIRYDDNVTQTFTLTQFNVEPAECASSVTYTCSVTNPGGTTSDEARLCGAGNPLGGFDGTFDGDATDGTLSLLLALADEVTVVPGIYDFTITATDQAGNTQTAQF